MVTTGGTRQQRLGLSLLVAEDARCILTFLSRYRILFERYGPVWHGKFRPELRRQLFLLAGRWIVRTRSGLYRPYYDAMLSRNGGCKTKAVCAVARKLVPMILRVAQTQEPFDRQRWLGNRHRRGVIAGDVAG